MQDALRFLVIASLYSLALFGLAAALTSCSDMKYAECVVRDRTSNPCN